MRNVFYFLGALSITMCTLVAFCGCATITPVPPAPPPEIYATACANLAKLGCPEGVDEACAATMQKAQEARLVDLKPACLAGAASVEAARSCGSVTCSAW